VRKTLASSGAKKNAEVLATAGVASAAAGTDRATAAPITQSPPERTRKKSNRSLFDQIDGVEEAPPAPTTADGWKYDGYELVDTPERFDKFLGKLKKEKRFVFDLETTGLNPISDAIVGYAFSWEKGHAYYLPVRAPEEDKQLDPDATLIGLKPIFENPKLEKRNHNIKFDQIVLAANGVALVGVAGDSMLAHYLLEPGARTHGLDDLTLDLLGHKNISITELIGKGKKQTTMDTVRTAIVRDYAGEDADAAWQLGEILEPRLAERGFRKLYDQLEIPLIGVLADLELTGIRVDVPFLNKLGAEMGAELAELESAIHGIAGREFKIGSLPQLQKVLFEDLKLPVQKRTGIKNEPSTDQESLERLAALGHALPKKLIEYRQLIKLKGTYVDVLPTLVNDKTGRIHTSFNQTAAETGRLSSSDPNLQNIPARREQGAQLRKAFIPREGWKLVTADYSQVELRLLAHFCGDETLRKAFAEDRDVHSAVAAQIFKVKEADVTKAQRAMAKTVNFGVVYGMSAAGLSTRLAIPRKEAEEFIDQYFARYPKVLDYQQRLIANAHKNGEVGTILGRKRSFNPNAINPNSHYKMRGQAEREAINMEIQGSAADLMKKAMLAVHARLAVEKRQTKTLLTVHDELVFEAPPKEVAAVARIAREEMTGAMKLDVALKVDVAAGPNWLDVTDV
jgi:DNA polymerase-1